MLPEQSLDSPKKEIYEYWLHHTLKSFLCQNDDLLPLHNFLVPSDGFHLDKSYDNNYLLDEENRLRGKKEPYCSMHLHESAYELYHATDKLHIHIHIDRG